MCRPVITKEVRAQVRAEGSSDTTAITLPWMLLYGGSTLRIVDEMQAETGTLVQTVRRRYAAVLPKYPGTWTDSGSTRSSDGIGVQDVDVSGTTDQLWVQVALAVNATSGAAEAYSMIRASLDSAGKMLVRKRIEVQPRVNSSQTMIVPLADPSFAVGLTSFMFGTVLFGLSGTISYQPAWRLFDADAQSPGAWNTLGTARSSITADERHNFGTLSVTPGTKMYAQPGLAISGTDARGTFDVIVAARWG